jgi:transketolase
MRDATCRSLIALYRDKPFVFLTGDLGFRALEPLRDAMGPRFINAGVAEQNMVSVAAGIAKAGEQCWVYSIAPFIYARPFEQIRNDICLHGFDVKLVGNGGGYAYGSMGSTHHALEDYGALLTLQNIHAFIPAFADDVSPIIRRMSESRHPGYLRLGRCEKPASLRLPAYAAWRCLIDGAAGVAIVVGPIAGSLIETALRRAPTERPGIWVLSELPLSGGVPAALLDQLARDPRLVVVEEHAAHGSAGHLVAAELLSAGMSLASFRHFCAKGYPSGAYGSQAFHRKESGLEPETILNSLTASATAR